MCIYITEQCHQFSYRKKKERMWEILLQLSWLSNFEVRIFMFPQLSSITAQTPCLSRVGF